MIHLKAGRCFWAVWLIVAAWNTGFPVEIRAAGTIDEPVLQGHSLDQNRSGIDITIRKDPPPAGPVLSYPEWFPADGVLLSWKWFDGYLTELVREIVPAAEAYIIVDNGTQAVQVTNILVAAGVPMDNVSIIEIETDTIWLVDYGPFFVYVDDDQQIIDHLYGWPEDDLFPSRIGAEWYMTVTACDLWHEGGNFIADGQGTCFITNQLYTNNPDLTKSEVDQRLHDYCGCNRIVALEPLTDYTGHIDMFAKLLDEDTWIVGQYDPEDPEYSVLENNASTLAGLTSPAGTPYEIVRIPMPGEPADYWTYTNSLHVNNRILVPVYNAPEDAMALQIYETAMPGYTAVGVLSTEPIEWGGAIHCTTRVVPRDDITPPPTYTPNPTPATPTPPWSPTPVPSSSPSPPVTSTPTRTPSPQPTAFPSWTPAPTQTETPSSTPAPSSTPEQSPTATPTPDDLRVELTMPASHYSSGDSFYLTARVIVPDEKLIGMPLFVILDVYGQCFFGPGFSESFDHYLAEHPEFETGVTEIPVIPEFQWPENAGQANGIYFHGALVTADLSAVLGQMSSLEFSWE